MVARRSIQALGAGAIAGCFALVAHISCVPDLDQLAAGNDKGSGGSAGGGTASSGGTRSGGETGGSGGSGGTRSGGTNAGATSSSSGGSAAVNGSGGSNGVSDVTSGTAGAGGVSCEDEGLSSCPDETGCFDLAVGTPEDETVTHCGTCEFTCNLNNATSAACGEGQCRPTCETGFDDCNAELDATEANAVAPSNDGCETDITVVTQCGACGYACSDAGATGKSCNDGRCEPTCMPHFGDCNAGDALSSDDGCETYLESITSCRADCSTAAVACDATQVCTAGSCGEPQGVVVFSVPLTQSGQIMRYADKFPGLDLSGTSVYVRIYAPGATAGQLTTYYTSLNDAPGGGGNFPLSQFADGWNEIRLPTGGITGNYNPALMKQLNFEIQAGNGSSWEPNPVVIYIDSVRAANGRLNDTFDEGLGQDKMAMSSTQVVEGSTLTWTDSMP